LVNEALRWVECVLYTLRISEICDTYDDLCYDMNLCRQFKW
jgi:hypothetical protein